MCLTQNARKSRMLMTTWISFCVHVCVYVRVRDCGCVLACVRMQACLTARKRQRVPSGRLCAIKRERQYTKSSRRACRVRNAKAPLMRKFFSRYGTHDELHFASNHCGCATSSDSTIVLTCSQASWICLSARLCACPSSEPSN